MGMVNVSDWCPPPRIVKWKAHESTLQAILIGHAKWVSIRMQGPTQWEQREVECWYKVSVQELCVECRLGLVANSYEPLQVTTSGTPSWGISI